MQVVVLAGGVGSRLRPWTNSIPKPLLPVLDPLSALVRAGEVDVKLHAEVLDSLGLEDVDDVTSI